MIEVATSPSTGNQRLPVWRVMFRHTFGEIDGPSRNTYALSEAIAMMSHWSPRLVAKASLVPAGIIHTASPACSVGNHPHCARLGAVACSCSCHGLRETT